MLTTPMIAHISKESSVFALMEEAFASRRPLALDDAGEQAFILPRVLGRCPKGLPMMVAERVLPVGGMCTAPTYSTHLMVVAWPAAQRLSRTKLAQLPHRSGTPIPPELLRDLAQIVCVN